jgi:TnpA family transposase
LFTQVVDWDLIARHWQDMMQVVLSMQAGHVVLSMLLRKLGVYSRHSALYKAFSELGRLQRTIFLLTYMIDPALQQHIRAETTNPWRWLVHLRSFAGPIRRRYPYSPPITACLR